MITAWDVLKRLEHFIDIDSDEKGRALSICTTNLENVFSTLKDDCDKNDLRIKEAAAAMSFYDYALKVAGDGTECITSFKAGDVSVSKSSQSLIETASGFRRDALNAVAPLCRDDNFFIALV